MSSTEHMLVVPTLDIDLVWHSHQLSGSRYQKDCKTNVGRYIDQYVFFFLLSCTNVSDPSISDDKVEQFHLSNAFDATCRAWEVRSYQTVFSSPPSNTQFHIHMTPQKRYGAPYTQCGCPLPGNTIGQKLARLVPHVGSKHYPPSRVALPADQPEILAASHPSDHNTVAVLGLPNNSTAKAQRESKALRRREREASRVRKGKLTQEEFDRNAGHAVPFLVPVPLTAALAPAPNFPLGRVISTDLAPGSFAGCATVWLAHSPLGKNSLRSDDERLSVSRMRAQLVSQDPSISTKGTWGACEPLYEPR
jgi:hypothetical protein